VLRSIQGRIIFLFSLLILSVGVALTLSSFTEASLSLTNLQRNMLQQQLEGSAAAARVYMTQHYGTVALVDGSLRAANGKPIDEDTFVVDALQTDLGVVATVFVKDGDDFRRITTNVLKEDGTRAVGTMLGKDSAAYPAVSAGKSYLGNALILGKEYAASYEPLVVEGNVVGILFIGVSQAESAGQIATFRNRMLAVSGAISIGLLLLSILIAFFIGRAISRPILRMVRYSADIAELDIRNDVPEDLIRRSDEIGEMAKAFEHVVQNLRDFLGRVLGTSEHVSASSAHLHTTSDQVSRSADEVARTVMEIAQGATEQARHTDSGVHGIEKLGTQLVENGRMMDVLQEAAGQVITLQGEGTRILTQLVAETEDSRSAVESVAGIVRETRNSAEQISRATDMIQQLAAQTNLLALNAAIEAARAGEQGKGFVVVAENVKKLAEQSAKAAEEIGALIGEIQHKTNKAVDEMNQGKMKVQEGVTIINRAGALLDEIGMASESVNVQVQDISKSSAEQSKNIESVSSAIENLSLTTKTTTSEVDQVLDSIKLQKDNIFEMARITKHLAMVSEELKRMLTNFVLEIREDAPPAEEPVADGQPGEAGEEDAGAKSAGDGRQPPSGKPTA